MGTDNRLNVFFFFFFIFQGKNITTTVFIKTISQSSKTGPLIRLIRIIFGRMGHSRNLFLPISYEASWINIYHHPMCFHSCSEQRDSK